MRLEFERVPTWPLYVAMYILAGIVTTRSLSIEAGRQCGASSPMPVRQQAWLAAIWPVTAVGMVLNGQDPMASVSDVVGFATVGTPRPTR
jgi:hypothetical protein